MKENAEHKLWCPYKLLSEFCTNYECKSTCSTHNFSGFQQFLILLRAAVELGKLFISYYAYMGNSLQIKDIKILKVYEANKLI